jgi:SAM-dependent methyltransferase
MYSLNDYGEMIADIERFAAYEKAIAKTVRPGDAVAEIGCGPGVFSLLACRAGARRVFAIDTDDCIEFARQLAAANGFDKRMEFFQSDSRNLQLPERVNVIISDLRGSLPLFGNAVAVLGDARERFLAPSGRFIPQNDTLRAALIEADEFYARLLSPWSNSIPGLNLTQAQHLLLNARYTSEFKAEQLLTHPQSWAVLDYTAGASPSASADLRFLVTRAGTVYGVCLWFDTVLFDNIGYSSGPGMRKTVYGQVFLPWLEPVPVQPGQAIEVRLQANLVGEDYMWCWDSKIDAAAGGRERSFQQSTFYGTNLSAESLRRRAADFVPALSEQGEADRWLLQAMDGETSLQQMAQAAAQRFPAIFPRWEDALHRAAELAAQFSR